MPTPPKPPRRRGSYHRGGYIPDESELPMLPLWLHLVLALAFLLLCAFLIWNARPT